MRDLKNILVVQTAFLGDVILTLPLVQVLQRNLPSSSIDLLVIPRCAELLANHPAVRNVLVFDKRGKDAGLRGVLRMSSAARRNHYDVAFVPHRSLRSAAIVGLARIPQRVGFHTSAGRLFFNHVVRYEPQIHEVQRNLRLLNVFGIDPGGREYPELYPSELDRRVVNRLVPSGDGNNKGKCVGIAPGTVWNTKRWPAERFTELVRLLAASGWEIFLLGGSEDRDLCQDIARSVSSPSVHVTAGELTLLQSAELIRRCQILISNDSAPMHLALAVQTPVVAIYGATIPGFGFAPYGKYDVVVETSGLSCRPCSIHGGDECPITTFDCMRNISAAAVHRKVLEVAGKIHVAM